MTNDTSTLNGALQELGETMASNLQAKGVTASASDGLTTLAGKILTIPAGSCYHIEFSEDSYTAVGGSATLEIYLQENYAPKVGATVTVTGSDSSLYTGITDSDGLATVTVTNISAETSFTASYNNVSDTCTVTISSYIFYDEGSASGVSNYPNVRLLENKGTTTHTLEYDTTVNAYHYINNSQKAVVLCIEQLTGYTNNFKLSADIMRTSTSYNGGLSFMQKEKTGFFYGVDGTKCGGHYYSNGSWGGQLNNTGSTSANTWYHLELVKNGTTISVTVYDSTGNTQIATVSRTYSNDVNYYAVSGNNMYFKNIKAEAL